MDSHAFLFLFSDSRLLQWIVAPTTSGRYEVNRVLMTTRRNCCHRVSNVWVDRGAALASARCRMQPARRVTRIPADYRGGCLRSLQPVFTSRVACIISALHHDGRLANCPKRGTFGGYSVMARRCNILPQARDTIVNRPTGSTHLCQNGRAPLYRAAQRLLCPDRPTTMCHPCATLYSGIHTRVSEGWTHSVNVCERAPFPGTPTQGRPHP